MQDINEIWLAIEELQEKIRLLQVNSHPPINWNEILASNVKRIELIEKELEHLKRGKDDG